MSNGDGGREELENRPGARRGRQVRDLASGAGLLTVGMTFALSIVLGVLLGLALDRWLKTNWIVMVGALIGIAAGFQQLFKAVAQATRHEERLEREEREGRREQDRP